MPGTRLSEPRQGQSGFTLLEILVALFVLGLLVVGLSQGVRAGLDLWAAQSRRVHETASLDAVQRALRELLTAIPQISPTGFAAGPSGQGGIRGTTRRFTFVGELPNGRGRSALADIRLESSGKWLVIKWAPHLHEYRLGPPPRPTETRLLGGVRRLQLAYWGEPAPGQPAKWLTGWNGPGAPELIRVHIAFAKGDSRHWPDLIAATRP